MRAGKGHRRPGKKPVNQSRSGPATRSRPAPAGLSLYGVHAVLAALANPARPVHRVMATQEVVAREAEGLARARALRSAPLPAVEDVSRHELDSRLPRGAVHQGIAAEVGPLPELGVEDICRDPPARAAVLVLDQVTDPQNVGAVLRSAAALGALALLTPERGAPEATGALAKAASGALERVPLVHAVNLRRALETLKAAGFWCVGLDHGAEGTLDRAELPARAALVLGAEGAGLRRLTRETCDLLLRIPIGAAVESLNVSTAAAIALYEWTRQAPRPAAPRTLAGRPAED